MTMTPEEQRLADTLAKGREVRLPEEARIHIRSLLESHMAGYPVSAAHPDRLQETQGDSPVPSPLSTSVYYHLFVHSYNPMPLIAGLIIALFLGGGTSYAAEGSLPGDLLYPVKTHVNETVLASLAVSPEAQANVQADIAMRRLDEAQRLAARGTLGMTTAADLAAAFDEHAQKAHDSSEKLRSEDPERAAEIDSSLAARIAANADILGSFSKEDHDQGPLNGIVASLTAHLAETEHATTTPANITAEKLASLSIRASDRLKDATEVVDEAVAETSGAANSSLEARLTVQAKTALSLASSKLDDGRQKMTAGNTATAYASFIESISASMQAKVYAEAARHAQDAGDQKQEDNKDGKKEDDRNGTSSPSERDKKPEDRSKDSRPEDNQGDRSGDNGPSAGTRVRPGVNSELDAQVKAHEDGQNTDGEVKVDVRL